MSWVAVAVAGAGLVKSMTVDADKERRDRKLAAETQRYAPWTGLAAKDIKEADPIGSTVAFGTTGLGVRQGIQSSNAANDLSKAKTEFYKSQTPIEGKPLKPGQLNDMKVDGEGRHLASLDDRKPVDPNDPETYNVKRRSYAANPWSWG